VDAKAQGRKQHHTSNWNGAVGVIGISMILWQGIRFGRCLRPLELNGAQWFFFFLAKDAHPQISP
jgi:hypothetical protein